MNANLLHQRIKTVVLLMVTFFSFVLNNHAQTIVTVGTGTVQNTSSGYPAPYGNWYRGTKEQMLILSTELLAAGAAAGPITALGFDVVTPVGTALSGFTISLANTTTPSLSGFITTGLIPVYSISSYTPVSGWNTHTFSTSFIWDGISNLLIETCYDNYPVGYTRNPVMNQTTTSFVSTVDFHSDGGSVCTYTGTGTTYNQRPNMQLTFSPPPPTIVEGHAYDGTPNNPLAGVEIGFLGEDPPSDPVMTDASGYYSLTFISSATNNTYHIFAFLDGQNYLEQEVTVVNYQTTTVDWNMVSPLMTITPVYLEVTMNPNEWLSVPITITNGPNGGPLTWTNGIIFDDTYGDVDISADSGILQSGESEIVNVLFYAGTERGHVVTADIIFTAQPDVSSVTVNASMIIIGDPLVPVNEIIFDDTYGDVDISWPHINDSLTGDITFEYYLIRRNGSPIANTQDTTYTDSSTTFGEYCYTVSAVYTEGETVPAGPECIIYCEAPSELDGEYYWNGEDDFGSEIWWEADFSISGSNPSGFNIYRLVTDEDFENIAFVPYEEGVVDYNYIDENLNSIVGDSIVCYQVTAVWEDGEDYCESMPAASVLPTDDYICIVVTDLGIPVAICQDVTVIADGNCEGLVTPEQVDNGSYNPAGGGVTLTLAPPGPYPLGNTEVTLTASNGVYDDTCEATIAVEDNTPPVLIATSETITLWPPNLQYETFTVADLVISVSDNCTPLNINDVIINKATSDEADAGAQCGNKPNDIVIASDCKSIQLRRERCGGGNGRVYTIYLEVDDGNGNNGYATCKVEVPPNPNGTAIDDGAVYEVMGGCSSNKSSFIAANENSESDIELINYPNPFNNSTTLVFSVKETNKTTLKVYNSMGQEVMVLFDGYAEADQNYEIIFSGEGLPGGLYICHMQSGNAHCTRRIVLVR